MKKIDNFNRLVKQKSIEMTSIVELNNKILVALAVLLTVSYGLSMASAGVSIPGCGEGGP